MSKAKAEKSNVGKSKARQKCAAGSGFSQQLKSVSWYWWTIVALAISAVIRLAATSGDLAIDEVWSLWFVQFVTKRFVDIFVLRHDNNHLLNTMILYVIHYDIGSSLSEYFYRIPPAIASIGTVGLAGLIAKSRGGLSACVAAWVLVGTSYLLVLYGTEARGYSYAIFFAYLAWLSLLRIEENGRWIDGVVFAVSASLGFLSHLTFVYCYAGFCVWTIWKWLRRPSWLLSLVHVLPFVTAGGLYLFFIRGMAIGGGPLTMLSDALIATLSIVAGGRLSGQGELIAALTVMLVLVFGFVRLWKKDRPAAACYFTIIVLAPACVLFVTGTPMIYPRYLLVPVAFSLLMIGETISGWWDADRIGRTAIVVLFGLYIGGNVRQIAMLLDHGRGDYSRGMIWMAAQGAGDPATVGSDHDFRNGLIFDHFASRLWTGNRPLKYLDQRSIPPQGTDWMIRHNFEGDPPPPNVVTDSSGNAYRLERQFLHHSLTGWNWWVYRRLVKPS